MARLIIGKKNGVRFRGFSFTGPSFKPSDQHRLLGKMTIEERMMFSVVGHLRRARLLIVAANRMRLKRKNTAECFPRLEKENLELQKRLENLFLQKTWESIHRRFKQYDPNRIYPAKGWKIMLRPRAPKYDIFVTPKGKADLRDHGYVF